MGLWVGGMICRVVPICRHVLSTTKQSKAAAKSDTAIIPLIRDRLKKHVAAITRHGVFHTDFSVDDVNAM